MARPSSRCGSIFLAIGFIVIFERYVFIGSLLQIYGIFYSFRDFLSKIAYWLNDMPIIGTPLCRKNHVLQETTLGAVWREGKIPSVKVRYLLYTCRYPLLVTEYNIT
jgi:hypothetical protein